MSNELPDLDLDQVVGGEDSETSSDSNLGDDHVLKRKPFYSDTEEHQPPADDNGRHSQSAGLDVGDEDDASLASFGDGSAIDNILDDSDDGQPDDNYENMAASEGKPVSLEDATRYFDAVDAIDAINNDNQDEHAATTNGNAQPKLESNFGDFGDENDGFLLAQNDLENDQDEFATPGHPSSSDLFNQYPDPDREDDPISIGGSHFVNIDSANEPRFNMLPPSPEDDEDEYDHIKDANAFAKRAPWTKEELRIPKYNNYEPESNACRRFLVFLIGSFMFLLVLGTNITSKIAFFCLATVAWNSHSPWTDLLDSKSPSILSALYMLIFLPAAWNLIWGLWNWFARPKRTNPWPSKKGIVIAILCGFAEGMCMIIFVLVVVPSMPPAISLLYTLCLFAAPAIYHVFYGACLARQRRNLVDHNFAQLSHHSIHSSEFSPDGHSKVITGSMLIGCLIQIGVIPAIAVSVWHWKMESDMPKSDLWQISLGPLIVLVMSIVWSHGALEKIHEPESYAPNDPKDGWVRGSMLFLVFRMAAIVVTGEVVAVLHQHHLPELFNFFSAPTYAAVTAILASYVGYHGARLSCIMGLPRSGFALALSLATPLTVACIVGFYYLPDDVKHDLGIEAIMISRGITKSTEAIFASLAVIAWLSQQLITFRTAWAALHSRLALDKRLFHLPSFNTVFLEQFSLLNRKSPDYHERNVEPLLDTKGELKRSRIFTCTTMYNESREEMSQLVDSLLKVDRDMGQGVCESLESHVFFDGGVKNGHLGELALRLISVLVERIEEECRRNALSEQARNNARKSISSFRRLNCPYGQRLELKLPNKTVMVVHFKDNSRVKNKKRWSQIMYMYYILQFRCNERHVSSKIQSYILATDADVKFGSKDVISLVTLLARDSRVGAICGRTYPLGSGPLIWYQEFDYAIGHWFQKAAEHVLGSVLCCPGCFSLYRVSELRKVVETYASSVEQPFHHLTKDMGEDRWLCTLLVVNGARLDYTAAAADSTYCPDDFRVFFDQRRRWISSTVANILELLSYTGKVTRNNESVSLAFMFYQALMLFSTVVSPATVILVVSGGVNYALKWDLIACNVVLSIASLFFVLICLFTKKTTQILIAKIMTAAFVIVMGVVVVGLTEQAADNFTPTTTTTTTMAPPTTHTTTTTHNKSLEYLLEPWDESQDIYSYTWYQIIGLVGKHQTPMDRLQEIGISTLYLVIIIGIFILGGLLHFKEFLTLFHGIWYLLCLPAGYIILLIYSCCNLDDSSWGTRVKKDKSSHSSSQKTSWWRNFMHGCGLRNGEEMSHFFGRIFCCKAGMFDPMSNASMHPYTDLDFDQESADESGNFREPSDWYILQQDLSQPPKLRSRSVDRLVDAIKQRLDPHAEGEMEDLQAIAQKACTACPLLQEKSTIIEDVAFGTLQEPKRDHLQKAEQQILAALEELSQPPNLDNINITEYSRVKSQKLGPWLKQNGLGNAIVEKRLRNLGYDDTTFLCLLDDEDMSLMSLESLPQGRALSRRLRKKTKALPTEEFFPDTVPPTISQWLCSLKLKQYIPNVLMMGYEDDEIIFLEKLPEQDIESFGITKRAHVKKFKEALKRLNDFYDAGRKPELSKRLQDMHETSQRWYRTKPVTFEKSYLAHKNNYGNEKEFWQDLIDEHLHPSLRPVENVEELPKKLKSLKYRAVLAMVLINAIWLLLMLELATATARNLQLFGTNPLGVFFLGIYGLLLFIQFITLIIHRGSALVQHIANLTIDTSIIDEARKRRSYTLQSSIASENFYLDIHDDDDEYNGTGNDDDADDEFRERHLPNGTVNPNERTPLLHI